MFQVLAFLLALSVSSLHGQQHTINGEQCTSTDFTKDYGYHKWYSASEIFTTDGSVMLKFYVVTKSDAHIMLARKPATNGYEINLGRGSNTQSAIYKWVLNGSDYETKVSIVTKEIVDEAHPVGFWVYASQESGLIMAGRNGEHLPLIFWKDPEPMSVNYYSFSSWKDVIGKWMFNCKPGPQSNTIV